MATSRNHNIAASQSKQPFYTGQDATEAFEDVGHSDEARELLPAMLIGEFEKDSVRTLAPRLYSPKMSLT